MYEKAFGQESPSIATDLNNMAELYRKLGEDEKAEAFLKRAERIKKGIAP
ncbi:MAG: tetratricopeptide repeat protein [Nitrospinota bacterium]